MDVNLRECENLGKEEVVEFLNLIFEQMYSLELKYEWDLYMNDMSCSTFFENQYFDVLNNLTRKQLNHDYDSKIAMNYPKVTDLNELFNIIDQNIDFTKIDTTFKIQKEKTLCEILKNTIMNFINELY